MKDFDFDELDRAVNSVLTKKDASGVETTTDGTAPDATAPSHDGGGDSIPVSVTSNSTRSDSESSADESVAVQTDHTQNDDSSQDEELGASEESTHDDVSTDDSQGENQPEPAHDSTQEPEHEETQDDTSATSGSAEEPSNAENADSNSAAAASLASIPVKRGRFMDVMAPAATTSETKPPMPVRGGVTLTPSADFSTKDTEPAEDTPTAVVASDTNKDSESTNSDEVAPSAADGTDATAIDAVDAEKSDTTDTATQPDVTDKAEQGGTTPFIPDVPVEKRPLNPLTPDAQPEPELPTETSSAGAAPVGDQTSVDPTLSMNVPKEFDKEIMAVESQETVGESDETHEATTTESGSSNDTDDNTDTATTDSSGTLSMAATSAEPHPLFDTSTLGQTAVASHHSSKSTWVVVAVSLFIVGAALGVLYFLYGQA